MGSFNVILYDRGGKLGVVRRVTLGKAIQRAEEHARRGEYNLGSVRRIRDAKLVGQTTRSGDFRFTEE